MDLSIFGDSAEVIEARVPRSVFGKLRVGDDVMVVDDDVVEPYRVLSLSNGGRDVRLLAVGPTSVEGKITAALAESNVGDELARRDIVTVYLDDNGRMVERHPDGTRRFID